MSTLLLSIRLILTPPGPFAAIIWNRLLDRWTIRTRMETQKLGRKQFGKESKPITNKNLFYILFVKTPHLF